MSISSKLNAELESAFTDFKKNRLKEKVIAQLVNKEDGISLYMLAKDPSSDRYYGILESPTSGSVPIFGISGSGIEVLNLTEVPMVPFKAIRYLADGTKTS